MKVGNDLQTHLTYCLNMHAGESWDENLAAIREHTLLVKERICPEEPFGLGLRLGNQAAEELSARDRLQEFKDFLDEHQLYAFTINGFPYGPFHGQPVKEDVYLPDWRNEERADYTIRLIDILAELLPEGVAGSISTVPVAYRKNIRGHADYENVVENLMACVVHAAEVYARTGTDICLALEPEPDCLVERTSEMVDFFDETLLSLGVPLLGDSLGCNYARAEECLRRHLGVCLDTCHMAVQFEDPLQALNALNGGGIRVGKIQVSSALKADLTQGALDGLAALDDSVYLHQVRIRDAEGNVTALPDIDPAALAKIELRSGSEIRAHMHVPLYFEQSGDLRSTIETLPEQFWREAKQATSHLEVETYTMDILPAEMKDASIEDSIAREIEWVQDRLYDGGL